MKMAQVSDPTVDLDATDEKVTGGIGEPGKVIG